MAVVIQPGDRIVIAGTSLTDNNVAGTVPWYIPLYSSIRSNYRQASPPITNKGTGSIGVAAWDRVNCPVFMNTGVGGQGLEGVNGLVANLSSRVYQKNPDIVIVEQGINDASDSTFASDVDAVINGCRANCPRLRSILWVGPLCNGENWPDGANALDAALDSINTTLISKASSLAFDYVDLRFDLFNLPVNYLAVHNPTHNVPNASLTLDGVHPLVEGAQYMSTRALAKMTLTG